MYRANYDKVIADQVEYKKKYETFRPFTLSEQSQKYIGKNFSNLIKTQNGPDTDDYVVEDNNKTERYLGSLPKGSKVLLLGVGTGRETLTALDLGLDAVGITFGSRNIDYGIKYLGLSPERHLEGVCEVLPFAKETFDCIAGFQIFEHTLAPLLFLLEQGRVLKYGGKLLLEWPPADNYTLGDNPHHQVVFTPGQAEALFQKAAFTNIKLYYDDMTDIPKEVYWSGVHNKMLCIEGIKSPTGKQYVLDCWE